MGTRPRLFEQSRATSFGIIGASLWVFDFACVCGAPQVTLIWKYCKCTKTDPTWLGEFDSLRLLPEDLRSELEDGSDVVSIPAKTQIFAPGKPAGNLCLVPDGTVKVQQSSDSGRDIFLYRLSAGESCVLSTACMLGLADYAAEAIAETDVRAVAVPRKTFDAMIARSTVFREFVFSAFSRRFTDLCLLIDELAFQRVDVRLAARLIELEEPANVIHVTHAALGIELGTAREVISRTMGDFQTRGWIQQARGKVTLTNREALVMLVRSSGATR